MLRLAMVADINFAMQFDIKQIAEDDKVAIKKSLVTSSKCKAAELDSGQHYSCRN